MRKIKTPNTESTATLAFNSATELARMIRDKEVSSIELTQYFIDRIERFDGAVNAVVVRDFERALDAAKTADAKLAAGETTGPLHGIPITVKEAYNVAGLATTWGVPSHAGNIATRDADVVRSLANAGAHVLGKSNVPLMLSDFQTNNEIFGTTNNPWDPSRGPGGSSGGSAAALAAGLTPLEIGSDLGGSTRNPAHFCGVYGHKPTWGIVPQQGHELPGVPEAPDMAVLGPMARSAEDLALMLSVIARASPFDTPGWQLALPPPRRTSLSGLRVAVWPTDDVSPVSGEISGRVQDVADVLARRGAVVSDQARPPFDSAAYRQTYVALVSAVMGAGPVLEHRVWLAHNAERNRLRAQWKRFFEDWDIVLCPVMATTALPHDSRPPSERLIMVDGEAQPYFQQVFWASLATTAYLPATVLPTGLSSEGLPIGLQAIGAGFSDRTTIEFARLVANELGGFVAPPGFSD